MYTITSTTILMVNRADFLALNIYEMVFDWRLWGGILCISWLFATSKRQLLLWVCSEKYRSRYLPGMPEYKVTNGLVSLSIFN